MAEVSLTPNYGTLRELIAEFLYGGDGQFDQLTETEQRTVDRVVDAGLMKFYQPPGTANRPPHDWRFMRQSYLLTLNAPQSSSTVTIVAGVVTLASGTWPSWAASGLLTVDSVDYEVSTRDSNTQLTLVDTSVNEAAGTTYTLHQDDYDLPDDFGLLIEPPVYAPAAATYRQPLEIVSASQIRHLRASYATGSSLPLRAAIDPKTFAEATGERWQIMFWPAVSESRIVQLVYRIRATRPTSDASYPIGASDHGQLIIAACYAAAEIRKDETIGVQNAHFLSLLPSHIERDLQYQRGAKVTRIIDPYALPDERPWPHYPHIISS